MGKGDTQRPGNRERISESFDRMFGRRCIKHRTYECADCFPRATTSPLRGKTPDFIIFDEAVAPAPDRFKVGDRVYVRELDVFGKIATQVAPGVFDVVCEPPMPNYVWHGGEEWLRPASYYRD